VRFQLKELVLWPRNPNFPPKRVSFTLGSLNVISGVSRTGKSAVIPIVDYCLGAETCSIPVKTIRDHCSWFGVIVATPRGERLLARREPGSQVSTGDMFTMEGPAVEPPLRIEQKNTTVDAVKHSLDELAGLSRLDFETDRSAGAFKPGRPSFRDMMAFAFQPQNIIANRDVLFFRAHTHEHREKLRTIFPYVLGALTPEVLAKQHELGQLRRDLQRKERELAALRQVSERWISEIRGWASQARELGLMASPLDSNTPISTIIDELRRVTLTVDIDPRTTEESVQASVQELVDLQQEESSRAVELAKLRRRLVEMERLRATATEYGGQLHMQRDRLKVAEWLAHLHSDGTVCPVCGQGMGEQEGIRELLEALVQIELSSGQFREVPAAFDREEQRVREELRIVAEKLDGVRHRIRVLSQASAEANAHLDQTLSASRFVGRLEQALEHYERLRDNGELAAEVTALAERVRILVGEVDETEIRRRAEASLRRIANLAQLLLPRLDIEDPNDLVALSITELTIRVTSTTREDVLWAIGSGSNWLSYHLAFILALQQFFLTLPHSPVPSFVILDQPSQVYFPRMLRERVANQAEPAYSDEDVEAVRKAFQILADVAKDANGALQIIVLDHATDTVWGGVEPLTLAAEWRRGDKLVPPAWIQSAEARETH
jgi:Protein of unknown function (DUF3732)